MIIGICMYFIFRIQGSFLVYIGPLFILFQLMYPFMKMSLSFLRLQIFVKGRNISMYTVTSTVPPPPTFQVYSHRPRPVGPIPDPPPMSLPHPAPVLCCPDATSSSNPVLDDLPIALWKGKHTRTYLVSYFVSYNHLSPTFCSFIASLDFIFVPKTVKEVISHPGWHVAMVRRSMFQIIMVFGLQQIFRQVRNLLDEIGVYSQS